MELQEGDGLMARSRRRENLLHRTFCGMRGHAQTQTNSRGRRGKFSSASTSRRPTAMASRRGAPFPARHVALAEAVATIGDGHLAVDGDLSRNAKCDDIFPLPSIAESAMLLFRRRLRGCAAWRCDGRHNSSAGLNALCQRPPRKSASESRNRRTVGLPWMLRSPKALTEIVRLPTMTMRWM